MNFAVENTGGAGANDPVTLESASYLADRLKAGNDQYAFALAKPCILRLLLRFLALRSQPPNVKAHHAGPDEIDDLTAFYLLLCEHISPNAVLILQQAFSRYGRYQQLAAHVTSDAAGPLPQNEHFVYTEGHILKAILEYELALNSDDPSWNFEDQGLRQLNNDFLLLIEYLKPWQNQSLEQICNLWGDFFLSPAQQATLANNPSETRFHHRVEALKPILRPFWFFS